MKINNSKSSSYVYYKAPFLSRQDLKEGWHFHLFGIIKMFSHVINNSFLSAFIVNVQFSVAAAI